MEPEFIESPSREQEKSIEPASFFHGWKLILLFPLWPLFGLIALPLILLLGVAALVSIGFAFVMMLIQNDGERRFVQKMKSTDRLIAWSELEPFLVDGQGTLVIEQAQKMPARIWWTPENLVAIAPHEPPAEGELDYFFVEQKAHPFVLWCHQRFLDEAEGTAILTEAAPELPGGLGFAGFFQGLYPRLLAIDTVYCLPHQVKQRFDDELA